MYAKDPRIALLARYLLLTKHAGIKLKRLYTVYRLREKIIEVWFWWSLLVRIGRTPGSY